MSETKPCPFCGGMVKKATKEINYGHNCYAKERYIYCTCCRMKWFPPDTAKTAQEIIEAWNRRHNDG